MKRGWLSSCRYQEIATYGSGFRENVWNKISIVLVGGYGAPDVTKNLFVYTLYYVRTTNNYYFVRMDYYIVCTKQKACMKYLERAHEVAVAPCGSPE